MRPQRRRTGRESFKSQSLRPLDMAPMDSKGDVVVAFTTSGKSRNILRALEEAKHRGLESICFLGRDGGFTKGAATLDIIAPGTSTARIQEAQKLLFHVLCETVDGQLPKS